MSRKKLEAGDIEPITENGCIKWDVKIDDSGGGFICDRQIEAEILSRLVKIMKRLDIDDVIEE